MKNIERPLKILLLEDSSFDAEIIKRTLLKEKMNCEFHLTMDKKGLLQSIEEFSPDVVLSDNSMPQFNATEALRIVREQLPLTPFILITGTISEEFAVNIIKEGADDYILKDRMTRLPSAINMALRQRESEKDNISVLQKLMRSEEKYRTLVERVSDGFIALDKEWKFIYVNKIAASMFGRPAHYLTGRNIWKEYPSELDKPFYKAYHEAMQNQKNIYLEGYSDAINLWMYASIYPSPSGLSIFLRDITEQRKAEQETKKTEEKYRSFIERITDAFISLDKNWRYTYLNKQAGELIHRNPAEMIGKNVWEEFPDVVGSATYEAFSEAIKEQHYVTNIDYYAPFDLWQENHIYPSKDGLSVFIRDITEKKKAEEALISNELRFRTLTSNAPVGIFQTNAAGKTIYVNETWLRITELTFDEAMGDGWETVVHPDDQENQRKQWREKSAKGLESSSEFRLIDKKGNTKWVVGKATPVFNSDQQITGYIGTLADITENKIASEAIQKNEEQYRDLVENITDLICTHDLEGRILSVNKAAEELLGFKFNPQDNLNIKDILAPDKKDMFKDYIRELKNKGSVHGLMKIKTFNGNIHIWEYNNSLKTIGVKTPVVRGYARDITETRKAEENLRQSELRLNEAQAIAHISNWEIDLVQNNHVWSDEFYRIYGLDKNEVQPSAELFLSFVHPEDAVFAREKMKEAFDTLKSSSFNFRFIRKDNIIRHGYAEWRFEFDKKGKPLRLYGIVQDITERKQAEEERKKLEYELLEQQRSEQLKITATALEAQEKERNEIGRELHDNVNQILVGTKLILSMVKNKPKEAAALVEVSIKNLQDAIIENRKIAHELVAPDFESTSLVDQISNLTDVMLKSASVNVHIDIDMQEKLLNDKQKLAIYRIAQEQCTNIIKYAKAKQVTIFLSTTDNIFKMIIVDDGQGMDTGKKAAGIGLRNIKGRLSIFNGTATIKSKPGKGFSLTIEIPLGLHKV